MTRRNMNRVGHLFDRRILREVLGIPRKRPFDFEAGEVGQRRRQMGELPSVEKKQREIDQVTLKMKRADEAWSAERRLELLRDRDQAGDFRRIEFLFEPATILADDFIEWIRNTSEVE